MRLPFAWFALVLAAGRAAGGVRGLFRPAEVRRHEEPRKALRLDLAYYPARTGGGYELIPKDAYFDAVEALLTDLS